MPDGTIAHVELRIDDTVVMLAEGGGTWPPFPTWLRSTFPTWMRPTTGLLTAGGVAVQAPEQKPGDPDRRGGVKDPSGNTWWFSTPVG